MDVKYIGGDVPWTLPFGDHFYSSSQASFTDTQKSKLISTSDLENIARRYDFEPFFSSDQTRSETKFNDSNHSTQWMNAGVLFTDKTIKPDPSENHRTDFVDNHGHTFCYLCSINAHEHERTKPRDHSQRRKLIPYNNPKALKTRPQSADRVHRDPNDANLVPYRFIVRTGTGKNSGTRARVFLYMYGTENNWTSINLQARVVNNVDGFPSGSTRTFCLKGPEIGQLHHLNVNLVGARSDKEWFLKEIEITNLDTSVTWLCEFNCWLPKKSEDGEKGHRVKPTLNPQKDFPIENVSVYVLTVRTGGKPFAGTDSNIHVLIRGKTGHTRRLALTSNRSNLFEQNQLDTFAIVGWDIGDLSEITVDSDRSQLASDWDLKEMVMWKIIPSRDHRHVQAYFPFNAWLGDKQSTLKSTKDSYEPPEPHPRGPTCYFISVKTGNNRNAGTDANVFIIIYGKNGRTTTHELDNPGINDFEKGKTSEFTIMDMDVGEVNRIKIWHDNSGVGPGWFLESVIVRKKHSTFRPVTTLFIQRLEQAGEALYKRAREQLQKLSQTRAPSSKENDQRSVRSKTHDELGSNRSILRGSTMSDKTSTKSVRWGEYGGGSQEDLSYDARRMKTLDQKHQRTDSPEKIESGHFEHYVHWISSHNYVNSKWQIQSIEELNPLNFDKSIRSQLLEDRHVSSTKIKSTVNDRDDDVFEFEAKRWLAKDEGDRKIEVYLTPKSTKLSTETSNEEKSKASSERTVDPRKKSTVASDSRYEKHDNQHADRTSKFDLGPLERSPRSLTSLDRSPHDGSKTHLDDSRSPQRSHESMFHTSKRQDPFSIDKDYRSSSRNSNDTHGPSASQRDLLDRISREPPYHPRSIAASAIDTGSSTAANTRLKSTRFDNEPTSPLTSHRDYTTNTRLKSTRFDNEPTSPLTGHRDYTAKTPAEPATRPKSAARSAPELPPSRATRSQVYSSAYGTMPMDHF